MADNISDWLKKACAGDLDAYQRFIREFSPRVHAIAYQMVGNSIDAQDIAQNVFLRLYRSLNRYNPQFVFTTWLYRLTVNLSIDFLRKNARHRNISLEETRHANNLKSDLLPPDAAFENTELQGAIRKISEGMPFKQRKVFVLKELQGLSTEEVAQILKCKTVTVRVHLAHARQHVKRALKNLIPDRIMVASGQEREK